MPEVDEAVVATYLADGNTRRIRGALQPLLKAASASPVQPGALASAPRRVVLKIVPEKVVSWDHRKLGGRY